MLIGSQCSKSDYIFKMATLQVYILVFVWKPHIRFHKNQMPTQPYNTPRQKLNTTHTSKRNNSASASMNTRELWN